MADALETAVTANYGGGQVLERVLGLLDAAGLDRTAPRHDDLKCFDSFHLGGWQATEALLDPLGLVPGCAVLDIGCGIGGTARTIAARYDARVEAIDLTPEFVEAAVALSRMAGIDGVAFRVGSATALPYADACFDLATMLHVGMNVPDKPALFAEAARVLKPGGRFAVFDILRTGPGEITYPMPWAGGPEISFVESPEAYARYAAGAGLAETVRRPRRDEGIAFLEELRAAGPGRGMAADRLANILAALRAGTLAPVEMIFVKPT